jgi:hypothetical protein
VSSSCLFASHFPTKALYVLLFPTFAICP